MNQQEKFYYDKWIEQIQENKKLKLEIEKMKKLDEYNSNFKDEIGFLKREIKRYNKALKSAQVRCGRLNIYYNFYKKIRDICKNYLLYGACFEVNLTKDKQKEFIKQIVDTLRTI